MAIPHKYKYHEMRRLVFCCGHLLTKKINSITKINLLYILGVRGLMETFWIVLSVSLYLKRTRIRIELRFPCAPPAMTKFLNASATATMLNVQVFQMLFNFSNQFVGKLREFKQRFWKSYRETEMRLFIVGSIERLELENLHKIELIRHFTASDISESMFRGKNVMKASLQVCVNTPLKAVE